MDHFYDGQIKRYLTQFMRLMSNFSYKDAKGRLVQIPVRYGDMNRQVAQIINKNSENIIQSAPFIACYIKSLDLARDRLQDPTFVSKLNIRERAFDETGQEYLNTQGANYTVERLMPTPYKLQFSADIWTTNTDQKLQILEQLLVLFNPSMEIQTSNNFVDWTSLSLLELTGMTFTSRSVPQGLEQDIDIATLNFESPIWLTTPAKVKKLGIITNIITSMFADPPGTVEGGAYDEQGVDYFTGRVSISVGSKTLGNMGLLVLNNTGKLLREGESSSRSDYQQPGAKGTAKKIVVNGVPTTNSKGGTSISIGGLTETPPAGSLVRIGGYYYTVTGYSGDLANLTLDLDSGLAEDLDDDTNVFIQLPNSSPDNITIPVKQGVDVDWQMILDLYPGKFIADLSQLRLQKPDGTEIVGFLSLDPADSAIMHIRWDDETIYDNTRIDINGLHWDGTNIPPTGWDSTTGRGTVDAIIDPTTYNPRREDTSDPSGYGYPTINTRLLILEDIGGGIKDEFIINSSTNKIFTGQLFSKIKSHRIFVNDIEVLSTALRIPDSQETGEYVIDLSVMANAGDKIYYELNINTDGPYAWKSRGTPENPEGQDLIAKANDIIEWDGNKWVTVFNSQSTEELTYITNNRTGVQYVWDGYVWNKSFEGIYTAGKWRLVL